MINYKKSAVFTFKLTCKTVINSIALKMAKSLWSFGCSECNRVNAQVNSKVLNQHVPVHVGPLSDLKVENKGSREIVGICRLFYV